MLAIPQIPWLKSIEEKSIRLILSQFLFWFAALLPVSVTLIYARTLFLKFARLNQFSGAVLPARWAGIKGGENWRSLGWQTGLVIATITGVVVFWQNQFSFENLNQLFPLLPVVLFLAASNSLVEEVIFRLCLVSGLDETQFKTQAPLFSGIIFGGVHYFGAPGGLPGVLMAGFLGWFLAKSIQETGGMFWAWSIHFVLDIIIFSILFLN